MRRPGPHQVNPDGTRSTYKPKPGTRQEFVHPLSAGQAATLADFAQYKADHGTTWAERRDAAMILLGLLGLRLVECSRLRPQHLQENQLAVPTAKGGTPRRIPLAPQLAKTLQRIIAEGPSDRDHNRPDLIFYTAAMNAIAKGGMRDRMQQWTRPLLGEAIAFHRLRHTAATTAYLQHKDPIAVQALLGHKHLSTTTDYLRSILSIDADTMPNYPHPPAIAGGPPRPADDRQTTPIPGRPRPPTIRPDLTTTTSTEEF